MKKFLVGALALALTGSAMADAINHFEFSVNSSDDKMYVCNVGIKHVDGTVGHIDPNSGLASWSLPLTSTVSSHDFVSGYAASLSSDMVVGNSNGHFVLQAGEAFSTLVAPIKSFGYRISSLGFNLTSENYGTEMIVDVCYRGPQVNFYPYSFTDFRLTKNSISYTDTTGANTDASVTNNTVLKYLDQAGIKVQSTTTCDMSWSGQAKYMWGMNGLNLDIDANEALVESDLFGTPDVSITRAETAFTGLTGSVEYAPMAFDKSSHVQDGYVQLFNAPVYCVTRYSIKETKTGPRDWRALRGRFTVETEIKNFGTVGQNSVDAPLY